MSHSKITGTTDPISGSKQERCVSLAQYIIENNATVRSAGKVFGISKSTVHQDITVRLARVNPELHRQVRKILEQNKQERHIRGGLATKRKYAQAGGDAAS
ncbi:MAG: sporulation transcriptional regulator SpoIIID [Ruminiclostridium sp.]|nr:sporulation transcriptional regulator SpoIIID [Ruminiclostridium sp.]